MSPYFYNGIHCGVGVQPHNVGHLTMAVTACFALPSSSCWRVRARALDVGWCGVACPPLPPHPLLLSCSMRPLLTHPPATTCRPRTLCRRGVLLCYGAAVAHTHTHTHTRTHARTHTPPTAGVACVVCHGAAMTHTHAPTHTHARAHTRTHTHTHTPPPAGVACVMCYGAAVGGGSMPMPSDVPLRALYASTLASVCMWAVLTPLLFKWVQLGLGLGLGLGHTRPGQRVYVGRPYAAAVQVGQARVRGRGRVRARAHPPWPACACGPSSRRCCSSGSSVGGWAQRGRRVRVGLGGVGVCEWAQAGLARAGGLGWGRRVRLGSGGASMLHMGPLPTLLLP